VGPDLDERPFARRILALRDLALVVREDQVETAKLISRGTPVARMNTGIDGGMNKVFAAKLPDGSTGLSAGGDGQGLSLLAMTRAPGPIPSHVTPPRGPLSSPDEPLAAREVGLRGLVQLLGAELRERGELTVLREIQAPTPELAST